MGTFKPCGYCDRHSTDYKDVYPIWWRLQNPRCENLKSFILDLSSTCHAQRVQIKLGIETGGRGRLSCNLKQSNDLRRSRSVHGIKKRQSIRPGCESDFQRHRKLSGAVNIFLHGNIEQISTTTADQHKIDRKYQYDWNHCQVNPHVTYSCSISMLLEELWDLPIESDRAPISSGGGDTGFEFLFRHRLCWGRYSVVFYDSTGESRGQIFRLRSLRSPTFDFHNIWDHLLSSRYITY
jgi:hypothetical protein